MPVRQSRRLLVRWTRGPGWCQGLAAGKVVQLVKGILVVITKLSDYRKVSPVI